MNNNFFLTSMLGHKGLIHKLSKPSVRPPGIAIKSLPQKSEEAGHEAKKQLKRKSDDIKRKLSNTHLLQWNLELREFLLYSNRHWKKRYPQFRSNYQGDKAIGYSMVQDIVDIPVQYRRLKSLNLLTKDMLAVLPCKSFVIKETLGHAGNRVLCLYYDTDKKVYNDLLHHVNNIKPEKLLSYMNSKLDKDVPIIIEELLLSPLSLRKDSVPRNTKKNTLYAPPPDFKVYMIYGKPRLINIYFRLPEGRYEISFKPDWQRLAIKDMYEDLKALNYKDLPDTIPFELPAEKVRQRLLDVSRKLAKVHDAKFVRYDFYVIKDRIILGEITPLCGGIRNNVLKEKMLNQLFPRHVRELYRYEINLDRHQ